MESLKALDMASLRALREECIDKINYFQQVIKIGTLMHYTRRGEYEEGIQKWNKRLNSVCEVLNERMENIFK